jgi:hypothetical protein
MRRLRAALPLVCIVQRIEVAEKIVRYGESNRAALLCVLLVSQISCNSVRPATVSVDSVAVTRRHNGPVVISRPSFGVAEYIVTLRPEFDHFVYADSIARRVDGRVGYIYSNLNAFTLHSLSDTAVTRVGKMREVLSVEKSNPMKID